jgi:type I restriction enzyme R subunit
MSSKEATARIKINKLLEEEFAKFVADHVPEPPSAIPAIERYLRADVTSDQILHIIDPRQFTDLATNPAFSTRDFRAVPEKFRTLVPEFVKDYVSLNRFAP